MNQEKKKKEKIKKRKMVFALDAWITGNKIKSQVIKGREGTHQGHIRRDLLAWVGGFMVWLAAVLHNLKRQQRKV